MTGSTLIITASSQERVDTVVVEGQSAGISKRFEAEVAPLPGTVAFRGLLGLDFFEGRRLELDFAAGTVELS